jgi:integrase
MSFTRANSKAKITKENAKRAELGEKPLALPLLPFEPYVMRHTALTRMAPLCDAFTLARIAGHSSITITQRYCHPQADAVQAAFLKFGNREVVTEAGHHEKQLPQSFGVAQRTTLTVA